MRILTVATVLLLSTAIVPSFAQQEEKSPVPEQSQITTPVQPERTPQQSEQSRQQDRKSAEDTRMGRDWRAQQRDGERTGRMDQGQERMGRMNDRDDWDHRTVGRSWQMQREDRRGYDDEERPRVRIKICREYEDGDEVCHYRN